MGRHHSIFGDIKKAFKDVGHDISHSPVLNSVTAEIKSVSNVVVSTVKDKDFQKGFVSGFETGFVETGKIVGPLAFPEIGLCLDLLSAGPSMLSSIGNSISGVTSGVSALANPLEAVMPYLPIVGGVVGLLVLYKVMKKK